MAFADGAFSVLISSLTMRVTKQECSESHNVIFL